MVQKVCRGRGTRGNLAFVKEIVLAMAESVFYLYAFFMDDQA